MTLSIHVDLYGQLTWCLPMTYIDNVLNAVSLFPRLSPPSSFFPFAVLYEDRKCDTEKEYFSSST